MKMKAGRVEKMIRYSARTTGMGDDERTEGRRIRLLLEQISLEHAEKKGVWEHDTQKRFMASGLECVCN